MHEGHDLYVAYIVVLTTLYENNLALSRDLLYRPIMARVSAAAVMIAGHVTVERKHGWLEKKRDVVETTNNSRPLFVSRTLAAAADSMR